MARSNAIGKLRELVETEGDVRESLFKALGKLDHLVFHAQVLVATNPGEKYHSGTKILRTDKDLQENQFQGSVGMVIALGKGAFVDAPGAKFYGDSLKIGDWVLYRPADGLQLMIRQVPCRLLEDACIKMKVSDPSIYW